MLRGMRYPRRVKCPECGGCGTVEMPGIYLEVLEVLGGGESGAVEIAGILGEGVGATAINNRLEKLRGWGLVRRRRDGRSWRYGLV